MNNNFEELYKKFTSSMNDFFKSSKPQIIASALSGGADSSALTLLLKKWCDENNIKLKAIIVNHNLRPESKTEALSVKDNMLNYGIDAEILDYTGEIPSSNIEEVARNYRYKLIIEYCKNNNIKYVATGHNKDELAETFILNLTRGSGLYGLCGIPKTQDKNTITFIRPMLSFTKDELKNICNIENYKWVEDPSNYDTKYKRVKIRQLKEILNDLDLSTDRIINTIDYLRQARDAIEFFTDKCINNCITARFDKLNLIEISLPELLNNPDEIIYRSLTKIMMNLQPDSENNQIENHHIRSETIKKLTDKLKQANLKGIFSDTTIGNYKIKYIKNTGKIQIMYLE